MPDRRPAVPSPPRPTTPAADSDRLTPAGGKVPTSSLSVLPELAAQTGSLGPVTVFAASKAGNAHAEAGAPREDSYALGTASGAAVVVVADGLGSSRLAHVASLRGAHTALESIRRSTTARQPWDAACQQLVADANTVLCNGTWMNAFAATLGDVGEVADDKDADPATTLAAVRVFDAGEDLRAEWVVVGDCTIAVVDLSTGEWRWPAGPPSDTTETDALPHPEHGPVWGTVDLHEDTALLLCSDGVSPALARVPDAFGREIAQMAHRPPSAGRFSTLLDFDIPGINHDDRTLVVVLPRGPRAAPPAHPPRGS